MNAEKYQKEILHDMLIVGKCLVFPESAFIFDNLWSLLKKQLTPMKYTSTEELWKAFQDAWYKVPSNKCRSLVSSVRELALN